jgi:hypothetical protein
MHGLMSQIREASKVTINISYFHPANGTVKMFEKEMIIAAVGSTLFLTTDFDVMTRASFLDRVITMQLDSKYRRNLDFCQSVIARKSP